MSITPDQETIDRRVRAYVAAGSGLDARYVLVGNSDGPAPTEPFATVLAVIRALQGMPVRGADGEEWYIDATYLTTYSVQWYRRGAAQRAQELAAWAASTLGLDAASKGQFTYNGVSELRLLDDLVESEWEERSGVDMMIGYTQRYTLDDLTFFEAPESAGGIAVEIEV